MKIVKCREISSILSGLKLVKIAKNHAIKVLFFFLTSKLVTMAKDRAITHFILSNKFIFFGTKFLKITKNPAMGSFFLLSSS